MIIQTNHFIYFLLIKIVDNQMGNECPQCQTPIGNCTMRDVLKDQILKRDDFYFDHIKKGQYKKIIESKDGVLINETVTYQVVEPNRQKSTREVKQRPTELISLDNDGEMKLNFTQSKELISMDQHALTSNIYKGKDNPTLNKREEIVKQPLSLNSTHQHNIQLKKGVMYSGGTVDKQPHERGKLVWEDKTVMNARFFLGNLVDNQKVRIQFNDRSIYEGQVVEGRANGQGKVIFSDETYFQGYFKDDMPHGSGKHKMSDGTFYDGMFQNGLKRGKGKYYFEDGMYEGQFYNDMFHGEGIMILNDGRSIRGIWHEGNLDGKGQMQWQTGQKYIGNFNNYERQGQGTYYFADGREWSGQWKNDLQNGFGCYRQSKGQLVKSVWSKGIKAQQLRQIDLNRN